MLQELDELYVPRDERTLRALQRKTDELDRKVRGWAQEVLDVLPKGTEMIDDEIYILGLFLAQQRRRNIQIDDEDREETVRERLGRVLPFLPDPKAEWEIMRAAHRTVGARLESDVDRACQFFCRDRSLNPMCEPAIDWRVAIRYLAQELHRLATGLDLRREYYSSPQRFEIALVTRDLAANIIQRRKVLLTSGERVEEPAW